MIKAWFNRMNPRERKIFFAAAGIVFVLVNLMLWSWLFGALGRARAQLAERKSTRAQQAVYINERDLWTQRDQWIQQHQPALTGPGEASKLLDEIKPIAEKYKILIEKTKDKTKIRLA